MKHTHTHFANAKSLLGLLSFLFPITLLAQHENTLNLNASVNNALNPCISLAQYDIIKQSCNNNAITLGLNSSIQKKPMTITLAWPLQQKLGVKDCNYYIITNNVDVDATSGVKDYNCGTRTYNGHRGTDIVPTPYPFYKLDHNLVEVIAAADGIIVSKADSNFDKNCTTGANPYHGNYIALQHSDGSRTLYYHMKKYSLTSKTIGMAVTKGEFLGIVGSSGSSNIPHLHFEVWAEGNSNTLNDPYAGACNTLNATSRWTYQRPYKEPGLAKLQVNKIAPVLPTCPATETPNEDSCFDLGTTTARFYRWMKDDTIGLVTQMRILNAAGSVIDSWTGTSTTTYNLALYNSTRNLPSTAGFYTYEAIFKNDTCRKVFKMNCSVTGLNEIKNEHELSVYPNPFSNEATFYTNKPLKQASLLLYNAQGQLVKHIKNINGQEYTLQRELLANGIYFAQILQDQIPIYSKKIIITW